MKKLLTRTISGVIYVALIVGAILGGEIWFTALATVFAIIGIHEFQALTSPEQPSKLSLIAGLVDAFTGALLVVSPIRSFSYLGFVALWLLLYFIIRVVVALYDKQSDALHNIYRSFFSVLYVAMPLFATNLLYQIDSIGGISQTVLAMFIMIWLNDTGAFCVGSTMGRRRLCERLSPKKSWEGFYGGLVFCILAGIGGYYLSDTGMSIAQWIGMGIVVCIFSTWGDLFESLIKRTLNVKDSGNLIPGHGGILDRIDSLLLVAPAVLLYQLIITIIPIFI